MHSEILRCTKKLCCARRKSLYLHRVLFLRTKYNSDGIILCYYLFHELELVTRATFWKKESEVHESKYKS